MLRPIFGENCNCVLFGDRLKGNYETGPELLSLDGLLQPTYPSKEPRFTRSHTTASG